MPAGELAREDAVQVREGLVAAYNLLRWWGGQLGRLVARVPSAKPSALVSFVSKGMPRMWRNGGRFTGYSPSPAIRCALSWLLPFSM